jgi:VIT1/CCC1 family predicted Fe2+/Mn2+ transporter
MMVLSFALIMVGYIMLLLALAGSLIPEKLKRGWRSVLLLCVAGVALMVFGASMGCASPAHPGRCTSGPPEKPSNLLHGLIPSTCRRTPPGA